MGTEGLLGLPSNNAIRTGIKYEYRWYRLGKNRKTDIGKILRTERFLRPRKISDNFWLIQIRKKYSRCQQTVAYHSPPTGETLFPSSIMYYEEKATNSMAKLP